MILSCPCEFFSAKIDRDCYYVAIEPIIIISVKIKILLE